MASEVTVIERHKKFAYRLEINGYPVAAIQDVRLGAVEVGDTAHAGAGQVIPSYEAGMMKFDALTLRAVVPLDGPGRMYWDKWIKKVQDPEKNSGMRKKDYAQDCTIYDLGPDKLPIRAYEYQNAWVMRYDPGDRNSLAERDDTLEEVTLRYDLRIQREL